MTDDLRREAEALVEIKEDGQLGKGAYVVYLGGVIVATCINREWAEKAKEAFIPGVVAFAKAERAAEVRAIQKTMMNVLRLGADIPDDAASLDLWLDQRAKEWET